MSEQRQQIPTHHENQKDTLGTAPPPKKAATDQKDGLQGTKTQTAEITSNRRHGAGNSTRLATISDCGIIQTNMWDS